MVATARRITLPAAGVHGKSARNPDRNMTDFKEILESAHVIAVVGCSNEPARPSHGIARYLKRSGYEIVPINPKQQACLGDRCYGSILDVPDDVRIDVVNIFRNPRYTADMVREVITRAVRTGERPTIWTQIGVSSSEAERLATEAGLPYVKNRCILVERERVLG